MAEQKPGKPCYDNSRMAMYIMYTYIYIHIDTIVYIYTNSKICIHKIRCYRLHDTQIQPPCEYTL